MAEKKSGGGGNGNGETQVGSIVLYQPGKLDWLRGSTTAEERPQIPAIVERYEEEGNSLLIVFPTGATMDRVFAPQGEGDYQWLPLGQKSKSAEKAEEDKQAREEQQEQAAEKAQEEMEKMQEQQKKQEEEPEGTPTIQAQLAHDQKVATMLYRQGYPQPEE